MNFSIHPESCFIIPQNPSWKTEILPTFGEEPLAKLHFSIWIIFGEVYQFRYVTPPLFILQYTVDAVF